MKAKSKKVFSIIKHIILITICIIMIFPFYWMIATAFKDTYAVYEYPPKIFPNPLVVSNFGKVWELLPFGQAFVNSIKIVLTVVVIQLLTASMAAFSFAIIVIINVKNMVGDIIGSVIRINLVHALAPSTMAAS